MLRLRAMTESEFEHFRDRNLEGYAQDRARNFGASVERERAAATRQYAELLKDGVHSAGHYFWVVLAEAGEEIGQLWAYRGEGEERAFLYYIEVLPPYRGRGYGAGALELLEEELRQRGVRRIALNVFADNAPAQRLYARQGYQVTNCQMQKLI